MGSVNSLKPLTATIMDNGVSKRGLKSKENYLEIRDLFFLTTYKGNYFNLN